MLEQLSLFTPGHLSKKHLNNAHYACRNVHFLRNYNVLKYGYTLYMHSNLNELL